MEGLWTIYFCRGIYLSAHIQRWTYSAKVNHVQTTASRNSCRVIYFKAMHLEWKRIGWQIMGQYQVPMHEFRILATKLDVRQDIVNSYQPSAAYMRQWTGSELVQVMDCRLLLFSAKLLPEPMLACCQLDSWKQLSEIWSKLFPFSLKEIHLKLSSAKMVAILSWGRWVNFTLPTKRKLLLLLLLS